MFIIDQSVKVDPVRRWSLTERVFFACGACHILAFAFLERYPQSGFKPIWLKPLSGYMGNHIFVSNGEIVFDYHGYSDLQRYLRHTNMKANRWWPGWGGQLIDLPIDVLVSESKSKEYDGLWLREPQQFLHDAMPRARQFVARFPALESITGQLARIGLQEPI